MLSKSHQRIYQQLINHRSQTMNRYSSILAPHESSKWGECPCQRQCHPRASESSMQEAIGANPWEKELNKWRRCYREAENPVWTNRLGERKQNTQMKNTRTSDKWNRHPATWNWSKETEWRSMTFNYWMTLNYIERLNAILTDWNWRKNKCTAMPPLPACFHTETTNLLQ